MSSDPLLRAAAQTITRGSKSFALAARLFDAPTRARALLLYVWCRHCDDVTDEQTLGHGFIAAHDSAADRVARLREDTDAALHGRPPQAVPFRALARVAAETGLPHALPHAHIDGFALDAADYRCCTLDDTLLYCWHVAGVVGVMMAVVMGVSPSDRATLERACDLGLAFQLDNIARDIVDDAARDRSYLPDVWLADVGIPPGEEARPFYRAALAEAARRLVGEAQRYEASARYGVAALPFRSAWAVLAAADIYGEIGAKVVAAGDHAWHCRQATTRIEKLRCILRARAQAVRRTRLGPPPSREGLWTMPAL